MPEQCIGLPYSLEELGCSREQWEPLSLKLQPPGTDDFDDSILSQTVSKADPHVSAAALLFASEFERYKGRDDRILQYLFKAVEVLPDNVATVRALVDELESFHRPAEALPYVERMARLVRQRASQNPEYKAEVDLWTVGKIKYLAGDKEGAIAHWRTLPFYYRKDGEDLLKLYIEGCERRLAQYEANLRSKEKS
jgi:tetratricopeptide (TPR) repeat protein